MIEIPGEVNQILNIVKARFGLKTKSEAIARVVFEYGSDILEPELRPEFIENIQRLDKSGKYISFNSIKELKHSIENA
ncbi:MAG: DUF2683 family protein [candidate division Zixibacteria bacterium]|nr:DUF2683 family protein [candidate division Zixibacteria bacterium]